MGKKIKCILLLHGRCKEIPMGTFPSKVKAKQWISRCWNRPYTILPWTKETEAAILKR